MYRAEELEMLMDMANEESDSQTGSERSDESFTAKKKGKGD